MSLTNVIESGRTVRYHANPSMSRYQQTNADHQWGVVAIIMMLHPAPSKALITEALFHDAGERWAGDLPSPSKRANPDLAESHDNVERLVCEMMGVPRFTLSLEDEMWVHFADRVEAFLFMQRHGQPWSEEARIELINLGFDLNVQYHEIEGLTK